MSHDNLAHTEQFNKLKNSFNKERISELTFPRVHACLASAFDGWLSFFRQSQEPPNASSRHGLKSVLFLS